MTDVDRKPGRPRSAEADAAIFTKTLELLADEGLRGLSVEKVAEQAPRVSVVVKIDYRPGVTGALSRKTESLEEHLRQRT